MAEDGAGRKEEFTLPLDAMAKLLGDITPRRVQQLAKEGIIPQPVKGKYEMIGSVQGYIKYLRQRAVGGELASDAMTTHRATLLGARAATASFELEKQQGMWLHKEEVALAWTAIISNIKTRLMGIPTTISPRVILCKSANDAAKLIRKSVTDTLDELSKATFVSVSPSGGGRGAADAGRVRATAGQDDI